MAGSFTEVLCDGDRALVSVVHRHAVSPQIGRAEGPDELLMPPISGPIPEDELVAKLCRACDREATRHGDT